MRTLRYHQLWQKYHKLRNRLSRAIMQGRFQQWTKQKQQHLQLRLSRYAEQIVRIGKLSSKAALLSGLMAVSGIEAAKAQTFTAEGVNLFGLTDVGDNSDPAFVDIDGDGDLDVFVGDATGNTTFFENTGSSLAPVFAAGIQNPFGLSNVGANSSPTFAGIDGDSDLDAFIGNSNGDTYFFRNVQASGASLPTFSLPATNANGLTNVFSNSSPTFVDIDGDGDLDAFVGDGAGISYFFNNVDSSSEPLFTTGDSNAFGLGYVNGNSSPTFVDIDGDGDLDALVGADNGDIFFFENTGSATAPILANNAARVSNPFGLMNVGTNSTPTFVDIDGDGDLDAFVGAADGNITFFRNAPPVAPAPPIEPIPTIGQWGLFIFALLMLNLGLATLQQKERINRQVNRKN